MTYEVTQGDSTYDVEPLSNDEKTAEEFYNYGSPANASANTPRDLEREDTTQLFLYDGPDGVSLFVIHDEPNTDSGGDVTLSFTGLPQTASGSLPTTPATPTATSGPVGAGGLAVLMVGYSGVV